MTQDEIRRQELGEFLRIHRARVVPGDVGLAGTPRRRAPGLRREEVAQLAGISASWYAWLEQKRPIRVSPRTLDNLARVLQLNPAERIQLFQLALHQPIIETSSHREDVSPATQRMLDQFDSIPAFIRGRRWDVLAWNYAAGAFFFDFEKHPPDGRNLVWLIFTDPGLRSLFGADWETRARDVLARFRLDYGRYAGDAGFLLLVERLSAVSPEFGQWWPRLDVLPQIEGRKQYNHPVAGLIVAEHHTFSMTDNPELRMTMFSPADHKSMARMRAAVAARRNDSRLQRPRQNGRAARPG